MTQEQINEEFNYCAETGTLIRKSSGRTMAEKQKVNNEREKNRYLTFSFHQKTAHIHRAVWIMHNGEIPADLSVDHINRNRTDNRLSNLRLLNTSDNNYNAGMYKSNTSGHKGVSFYKKESKWQAQIGVNGRNIKLLTTSSFKKAVRARKEAELFYGVAHLIPQTT